MIVYQSFSGRKLFCDGTGASISGPNYLLETAYIFIPYDSLNRDTNTSELNFLPDAHWGPLL